MLGVNHSLIKPNKAGTDALIRDYDFIRKDKLHQDIEFSRASGATQTNSSGLVAYAPENLVTYTDDFSNSQDRFTYRSGHSISYTANQTDPNGGTDAALFANVTGTGANDFWKQVSYIGSNAPYIPSFFIKRVSTTGTIKLANPSGGTSNWLIDMSKLPDGWVRITPSHSAVTINTPFTAHSNGTGGIWFRSDDGSPLSFYLAFPQVERTFDNSSSGEPLDFIENKTGNALFKERFDFDHLKNPKGLLIEEASTNLFLNSDTNTWVQGINNDSVIRLDNYAISPSGVKDAPKFITTSNNVLKIISPSGTIPTIGTNTLFTFSCFIKKGNTDYVRMYHNDSTSFGVTFNLATGQVHSPSNNGDSNIEDYGNGWYRCWYSHTTPSTHSVGSIHIYPTDENSTITHANEWSVYLWQPQAETKPMPSSLIPTYGATASRSGDVVNVTGTNFSRFFKDTEGTFAIDIQMPKGWEAVSGWPYFLQASANGSNSNRINFYGRPSQNYLSGHIQSGSEVDVNLSTNSTIALDNGEISRHAIAYKEDDGRYSGDGDVFTVTDTSVTLPVGINRLDIGQYYNGVLQMSGWFRRLRYFNKRKTNAQVQKLTDTSFLLDKYKGAKAAHSLRSLRDGRDNSPVTRIRREYDSFEADYTANQVANGDLEKDFRSADQITLPLNISCEADEMIVGGDFTDLITNGDFASASGWTTSGGATIESGTANWDGSQSSWAIVRQNSILPASGSTVTATFTVSNYSAGILYVRAGALATATQVTANGTYALTLPVSYSSAGDNQFRFQGDLNFVGSVDNVSVVEGSWTAQNSATLAIENGMLKVTNEASTDHGSARQEVKVKIGSTYKVTADVNFSAGNAADLQFKLGTSAGGSEYFNSGDLTANTLISQTIVATNSSLYVQAQNSGGAGTNGYFDNVSVKEVNPIATGFSTRKINSDYTGYAMRVRNNDDSTEAEVSFDSNNEISLDSPVKATSMNLLAYSEDFGEWSPANSPVVTGNLNDPFGGQNAWSIQATSGGAYHQIHLTGTTITSNSTHTFSWYVKKETSKTNFGGVGINLSGGTSKWAYIAVDETNGAATTLSGTTTNTPLISVTEPVTGWYRVAVTLHDTHSNNQANIYLYAGFSSNGTSLSAVAGSARTIFGAQLEETVYESTGTELLTNGDFSTSDSTSNGIADWITSSGAGIPDDGTGTSLVNGKLRLDNTMATGTTSDFLQIFQRIDVVAGRKYSFSGDFDILDGTISGGGVNAIFLENVSPFATRAFFGAATADGTVTGDHVATITETVRMNLGRKYVNGGTDNDVVADIDNISVVEYSPKVSDYVQTPVISDAHNSTSATNLREFAGKENLLEYSEDFSQIYWQKQFSSQVPNAATDPNGGNTATKIVPDSTGNNRSLVRNFGSTLDNVSYTWSAHVKKGLSDFAYLSSLLGSSSASCWFNLTTGEVGTITTGWTNVTMTSLGNDWYRISADITVSGTSDYLYISQSDANGSVTVTKDGDKGLLVWGAQLNTNSLKDYQKTSGTAKTADVNVVNWYDQGMGEDFTQSTAPNQPRIVMGSELVTDSGGKASVYFDGGDTLDNNTLAGQNRLDSYFIQDTTDTQYIYPSGTNSSLRFGLTALDGSNAGTEFNYGTPSYYVNGALQSFADRDDSHDVLTGKISLVSQHNASTGVWTGFTVGHYHNGSTNAAYNYTGKISEMVFFPNMDSSPKRFPIEQNMMNHYIPNLLTNGDFSDGLTGWVAGGDSSLISVENGAIRINSPDSTFTQIYQTVPVTLGRKYVITADLVVTSGGVAIGANHNSAATEVTYTSSGSISQSFVATTTSSSNTIYIKRSGASNVLIDNVKVQEVGTSGYVTTLYDQAGNNNHALQATASIQPQLVSGGDLIKSGNHPAWEFIEDSSGNTSNLNLHGKIQVAHLDAWFVHDTSDTVFLYPNNVSPQASYGWVAQQGNTNTSMFINYGGGDSKLYVNNSLAAETGGAYNRGDVYTALVGRKLAHHQDAFTQDWTTMDVGRYNGYPNNGFNFVGKMSEMIWYDSDQSSNRTAIDTAINDHYNIY